MRESRRVVGSPDCEIPHYKSFVETDELQLKGHSIFYLYYVYISLLFSLQD